MEPIPIPAWLSALPDGLHGDVDLFLESYECGEQARGWEELEAINALSPNLLTWLYDASLGTVCAVADASLS